ncbi:MAG: SOS response-associated peptidase family protein [Bdellovibrionales bacterium]|nr:SOS response-associated peptidase family protein [Bdellovibrionales bacterium]
MCSRYQSPDAAEMARFYRVDKPKLPAIKSTIYPGYTAPALFGGDESHIEARFWGFVLNMPGKRDPTQIISKILQNAVSETVEEKRTFSKAWREGRRCILPASRFFEPIDGEFTGIKDPERKVMSIAGIYGEQTYKEKKVKASTMLTCEPNKWMSQYHDRMPVILNPDDIEEWLSPDTTPDQALKLCQPWKGKLGIG